MTKNQQTELKTKIEDELNNLEENIIELQEQAKPIEPECALGDLARFELMNDQVVFQERLEVSLIRRNRLRYALERLVKTGELLCSDCEEEIAFERLLALPEATLCIECASNQ